MSRPAETAPDEAPLEVRALRIDFPKRTVRVRGDEAPLTFVEFEILSALARAPGRVFTRDMLLSRIWGGSGYRDPRTESPSSIPRTPSPCSPCGGWGTDPATATSRRAARREAL